MAAVDIGGERERERDVGGGSGSGGDDDLLHHHHHHHHDDESHEDVDGSGGGLVGGYRGRGRGGGGPGRGAGGQGNPRVVYVGNLSYHSSWQDLKDHMRKAGEVVFADIFRTEVGLSKGCGVVEFSNEAEARNAIATLNETTLDGTDRPIFVREDRVDYSPSQVFARGGGHYSRGGGGGGGRGFPFYPRGGGGRGGYYLASPPAGQHGIGHQHHPHHPSGGVVVGGYPHHRGFPVHVRGGGGGYSRGRGSPHHYGSPGGVVPAQVPVQHHLHHAGVSDAAGAFNGVPSQPSAYPAAAAYSSHVQQHPAASVVNGGGNGQFAAAAAAPFPYRGRGGGGGRFFSPSAAAGFRGGRSHQEDHYHHHGGDGSTHGAGGVMVGSSSPGGNMMGPDDSVPQSLHVPSSSSRAGRQLFVGNLPYHISWQDLKDIFSEFGPIRADILLTYGGRSKGMGVVCFETEEIAEKAIEKMNNFEIDGRVIHVSKDKFAK